MRWMICWNDGMAIDNHQTDAQVSRTIRDKAGQRENDPFRQRLLNWLCEAQLGDVLEFPLGIVVRTSEQATEIDYEETGS